MSKMIQIRQVPNELHGRLKVRAALANMSLSEYLLSELRRLAERPTREEMIERLRGRQGVKSKLTPAKAIRVERDRR